MFNFPVVEFCWYGVVSLLSLLCFASLAYEVQRGLDVTKAVDNDEAWKVVWTTCNVNFVVMVFANIALMLLCIGIGMAEGSDWRAYFGGSIFVCGAYWYYTRACEKKLIAFLQQAGFYTQTYRPGFRLKRYKKA